ncbi:CotS family spore coat protein [Clostridium tyrobutyricum]|uniref:CotS family spore coat protein n=1 Tax=Clostridium tyrobutyricum TaxID=1519 RepID=UPI00073D9AFC|nr:CotS family spore coat protein [Clostridium tyrobutyricum]MBR9647898.1 CotS family spore coat protein [Clostridium tyrobutyricum]MBV4430774.1 CotS family spore coat protein [Clostridium tyrobutyricum]MBV4436774.1 CotS family spore coat protein [Clostridium tyrobutyricum]
MNKNINLLSEENVKQHVLPHYNLQDANLNRIKFKDTDKQRAVYKVDYRDKSYCLKKVYFDESELLFVYSAVEWLYRNNINVPRIIPTIENGRFVKYECMLFILTPWILGEKCNYDNKDHIISATINLSKMHSCCKNFRAISGSINRQNFNCIHLSFEKHLAQLVNSSNLAFKSQDNFSNLFLDNFEINYMMAEMSTKISQTINYNNLHSSLCHLDYVNKNIIFDNRKNIWIIDFDKCTLAYCSHDISYFLRRFLKRSNTNWNLKIGLHCLELYEEIFPLNLDDYKYIISYLAFPQKFWKISRDYYNNITKCNHKSFFYLLKKASNNNINQMNFIINLGRHVEKKFNTKIT